MEILDFPFNNDEIEEIRQTPHGSNWPVVYIINNDTEAYVGETLDAANRVTQHLQNPERKRLNKFHVITDETYNKSVILDLESFLIKYMSSDQLFTLQNSNAGISNHNYYEREKYEQQFQLVWNRLCKRGLAKNSLQDIRNSEIFKYSPYKSLNREQTNALYEILNVLVEKGATLPEDQNSTIVVEGGAGTGKTILAVFLMKLLSEVNQNVQSEFFDTDNEEVLHAYTDQLGHLKIGLVIPMQSLRKTIKQVFKNVKGLKPSMVLSPVDVPQAEEPYDVLIVDEAHRLRQRKALAQYPIFDQCNEKMGFGKEGTELDWIIQSSRMQILFYDPQQSIKPSDIDRDVMKSKLEYAHVIALSSQLRCRGGEAYIRYIKQILSDDPPQRMKRFDNYEFRLFDDVQEMIDAIKARDSEYGLCRTVAGYLWKWVSKKSKKDKDFREYDIDIDGHHYVWNTVLVDWVNSDNALNEIGCIHTVQGYDLNYTGVIFGNEINYDLENHTITVDKKNYFDYTGKTALKDDDELRNYIINIYLTMMTRGIRGTYVYVCNRELREYLRKYLISHN